jgi:uncharacterized membrane protein
MNKEEFLEKLRLSLLGEVNSATINENLKYYEEYIMSEIRKGKTEEDVLTMLGDPRLIAKTIIETNQNSDYGRKEEYVGERKEKGKTKVFQLPSWAIWLVIVLAIIVIIGILGSVVYLLAPIIIPLIIVAVIVRYINRK